MAPLLHSSRRFTRLEVLPFWLNSPGLWFTTGRRGGWHKAMSGRLVLYVAVRVHSRKITSGHAMDKELMLGIRPYTTVPRTEEVSLKDQSKIILNRW